MGNSVANQTSMLLHKDSFLNHMKFDLDDQQQTLVTLWERICESVQNYLDQEDDDRIFRLLLPDFDRFIPSEPSVKDITGMIRFLRCLQTLVKATNCVCLISVQESLLQPHLVNNLKYIADQVLQITSFKDHSEMKIGEYDGTLKILKHARVHSFVPSPLPDTDIFALRLSSKNGLVIERIHLEPEEDRAGQDENLMQKGSKAKQGGSGQSVASMACNPTKQHKIDF